MKFSKTSSYYYRVRNLKITLSVNTIKFIISKPFLSDKYNLVSSIDTVALFSNASS